MSKAGGIVRAVDRMVDAIAGHKVEMLAGAIATSTLLIAAAIGTWLAGKGAWLTKHVVDAGGYVAILATVLGIPALCYAMVTDRSVDALNAATFENMTEKLMRRLTQWGTDFLPQGHHMQLFRPDIRKTLLLPAYDPEDLGPKEGWEINAGAPQAVTGSAWVTNKYYWAVHPELSNARLRLTAAQRQRYAALTGVAAAPVQDASGKPIAVLTILTEEPRPQMASERFQELHVALAEKLAHIFRLYAGPLDFDTIAPRDAKDHHSGSFPMSDSILADARRATGDALQHLDLGEQELLADGAEPAPDPPTVESTGLQEPGLGDPHGL